MHNTIWLGTNNGIILTIRDFIKPERPYALEDSFRPFHGPIIQLKASFGYFQPLAEVQTSRSLNKDGESVMVIGKRYVPPLNQIALINDAYPFDRNFKVGLLSFLLSMSLKSSNKTKLGKLNLKVFKVCLVAIFQ